MERREQGVRKGQGGRRGAIWTREVQEQRLREREREGEEEKWKKGGGEVYTSRSLSISREILYQL